MDINKQIFKFTIEEKGKTITRKLNGAVIKAIIIDKSDYYSINTMANIIEIDSFNGLECACGWIDAKIELEAT